jgi:predicted O-methyltransferase YrrM
MADETGWRTLLRAVFSGMAGDARLDGSEMAAHMPTLHLLATNWSWGDVVEAGVGRGWSTVALLSALMPQGKRLISYDADGNRCSGVFKAWGLAEGDPILSFWDFRVKSSADAAADFADAAVSLFFLDTSHLYEHTKAELAAWFPKIHPDGIICGHDYLLHQRPDWATKSGVHLAVDEFAAAHGDRFRLQVLPHDQGLFILWPKSTMG